MTRLALFLTALSLIVLFPAIGVAQSPPAPAPGDETEKKEPAPPTAGERVRESTGLRFAVLESILRRNIIRTWTPYGFRIRTVDPGSPAAKIGLKPGDILLTWEGRPIRRVGELADWAEAVEAGKKVKITYARKKKRRWIGSRKPWVTLEAELSPRSSGDTRRPPR